MEREQVSVVMSLLATVLCFIFGASSARGAAPSERQWPCFRGNINRTGISKQSVKLPLRLKWVFQCKQPPQPAWPDPVKEPNVLDFDRVFEPVVADGLVLFGSSADNTLRAVSVDSGELVWRYTAGGPIRFAPAVADGRVYLASDDGWLRCFESKTGKVVWTFRCALNDRKILGNGRLISRWPLRSGVLVDGGVVYVTAGMWPSEGIFVYALDAASGKVIWCNDTSGVMYLPQPHSSAFAFGGVAPQGYLAASKNMLLVPTGRGAPARFDRKTGKLLPYQNRDGGGSLYCVVEERGIYSAGRGGLLLETGMLVPKGSPLARGTHLLKGIRVGNILFRGTGARVEAVQGREKTWSCDVEAEAHGLAFANDHLIVSTTAGSLYCFEPGDAADPKDVAAVTVSEPSAKLSASTGENDIASASLRLADKHRMTQGYGVVVGPVAPSSLAEIVRKTQLSILHVLEDEAQAEEERETLLDSTAFYGTRITAVVERDLPNLPSYFANVMIVTAAKEAMAGELYRMLRPCGGVMYVPQGVLQNADAFTKIADIPVQEIHKQEDGLVVVRGKLPGAFDWDSKVTCDQRVKWPLETLWFGGPGPERMVDRHFRRGKGGLSPVVANGLVFVVGAGHVIAFDAYNGTELWARNVPYAFQNLDAKRSAKPSLLKSLAANSEHVYLNFGSVCYQLDERTGRQEKVFGSFKPSKRIPLNTPQTYRLKVSDKCSGVVTIENMATGLKVTLVTKDARVMGFDGWELHFDFRPESKRGNLYEPGIFQLAINAGTARLRQKFSTRPKGGWVFGQSIGPWHPEVILQGGRTDDGTRVVLELPWKAIEKVNGAKPTQFAFAAALLSSDGGYSEEVIATRLFSDESAGTYNDGWPTFVLGPGATPPAAPNVDGKLSDLPEWARRPGRMPERKPGELERRRTGYRIAPDMGQRKHPLTGQGTPMIYGRAYGCGGEISSSTMDFFRSGTISFYDYSDDSGLRNFGAVKPSCRKPGNMMPAFGLLVVAEGSSGCACAYNFQTSLALAPAASRSNEDWAVMRDSMPVGVVRHMAVNLGAPGDRRESAGSLWLGFPRKAQDPSPSKRLSLQIPVSIEYDSQLGPYRMNADRTHIGNTDRPWIYASGYRGIRKLSVSLNSYDPSSVAVSLSVNMPPGVDGRLSDACWDKRFRLPLPKNDGVLYLRHDDKNLYVSAVFRKEAGKAGADLWKRDKTKADSPVWEDDCLELFFSTKAERDPAKNRQMHLAVSASGVRYDGLIEGFKDPKKIRRVSSWSALVEKEDAEWDTEWRSAINIEGGRFSVELAVPWETFKKMGWERESVFINVRNRAPMFHQAFRPMAFAQRLILLDSEKDKAKSRYTVRLHFSEPDDVRPGQRVFDVKLQGESLLVDFDIIKEAGKRYAALIKEFRNVEAHGVMELEMIPKFPNAGAAGVPVICGIEVVAEKE
jgi:outer membrane protein assembly factor BamB